MNHEEIRLQKQNFLRDNILAEGYESEDFAAYLESLKGNILFFIYSN